MSYYRNIRRRKSWRNIHGTKALTCYLCGQLINAENEEVTVDHLVPRSKGGNDRDANVVPAHVACNTLKGDIVRIVCAPELYEIQEIIKWPDQIISKGFVVLHPQYRQPFLAQWRGVNRRLVSKGVW